MNVRASIIGSFVSQTIRDELLKSTDVPYLLLRHFEFDEIVVLVAGLRGLKLKGRREPVKVVVATRDRMSGLPDDVLLAEGETLTRFRNTNESGLVVIETERPDDVQSLRNMRTISDREVMDSLGQLPRFAALLEEVWRRRSPTAGEVGIPRSLLDQTNAVFREVRLATSLRVWTEFLIQSTKELADCAGAIDELTCAAAVGRSLPALMLFPDDELFAGGSSNVVRRLKKNSAFSRMQSEAGKDLKLDELGQRIDEFVFKQKDGVACPKAENERLRAGARALVESTSRSRDLAALQLREWMQLFANETRRAGLGATVRNALETRNPERVDEFVALEVEELLDNEDAEAAETLSKLSGEPPIFSILPAAVQRRIEKLAKPVGKATDDPLRELLEILQTARDDHGQVQSATIRISIEADPDLETTSKALFRFLYGATLRDIERRANEGDGWGLSIDGLDGAELALPHEHFESDDEPADVDAREVWAAIRVVVRITQPDQRPREVGRFDWRPFEQPGWVAFARQIAQRDIYRYVTPEVLDDWLRSALLSSLPSGATSRTEPPTTARWVARREDFLKQFLSRGLEPALMAEYVAEWTSSLAVIRTDYVPRGAPEAELAAFVSIDTVTLKSGRFAMCPTHPIRMRWIERHSTELASKIVAVLAGGLSLNAVNRSFFFERLDRLSPHQQPPIVCLDGSTLAVATREVGWHEEYAAMRRERAPSRDWLSSVDDGSVDEMAAVVRTYLEAYPHKRDGVSVVVFLRDGDTRVVERLVARVRQREFSTVCVELHVFAPPSHYHAIAGALARFDSEDERGGALLPGVQSVIHAWNDVDAAPDAEQLLSRIDLALVPNLFGTTAHAQEKTKPDISRGGKFDPWVDKTAHSDWSNASRASENVSRVLLPEAPDPVLEGWSTLTVRNLRNEPVGASGDSSIDYVSVQVRFDKSRDFFAKLHRIANWVVTLDPFIGREQIEALETQPDIITVRPAVGKNDAYTLIVSSSAGRSLVERRIERKLVAELGIVDDAQDASAIAKRIYTESRYFAPGVLLRALGLGQTIPELLGLLVAREALEEQERRREPWIDGAGFEAWISLDEHADWFGGPQSVRADMLRIRGRRVHGRLEIDAHVLEAKFRERDDIGRAEQQVERTMRLVKSALSPSSEEGADDRVFWRQEVLWAIEQGCKRMDRTRGDEQRAEARGALRVWDGADREIDAIEAHDRQDIRSGDYTLVGVTGTICGVAYGQDGGGAISATVHGDIQTLRVPRTELARILTSLGRNEEPARSSRSGDGAVTREPQASADCVPPVASPTDGEGREVREEPVDGVAPPGDHLANAETVEVADRRRGFGRSGLERRYQELLDGFAEFGIRVRRAEQDACTEGPGFYVLRVVPDRGVSPDTVLARVPALKLKLGLASEQAIRANIDRGAIVFEVPKKDEDRYPVMAKELWARVEWPTNQLYAPLGEDVSGAVVGIDFSSAESPHLLVAGTTGSGKSVALEALLQGLARAYRPELLQFAMVDPKGTELVGFETDPHLLGDIGMFADDAIAILSDAVDEMDRRYSMFRQSRVRSLPDYNATAAQPLPWRVIVLDEYADLTADKEDRKVIEEKLQRLSQKARACGIHVIVATQKPSAAVLSTTIRSNLPAQLALRVRSAVDSRVIMDEAGAETLAGKGDAFFRTAKGIVRIQCAMLGS